MTEERKFTPPTKFPAKYVDGYGTEIVIVAEGPNVNYPFIGYDEDGKPDAWTRTGNSVTGIESGFGLHDKQMSDTVGEMKVTDFKENEDGSATVTFDMDDNTVALVQELGLKLLIYCGATGTDIDYVFDSILGKED